MIVLGLEVGDGRQWTRLGRSCILVHGLAHSDGPEG
jgi:hypothetical protein